MVGDGFYEGFRDGQNHLLAKKQDGRAQEYLDMNKQQTEFSQDFKIKGDFRARLQEIAGGLAELKSKATTPQRLEALNQQAQMVKDAFMVEAEKLGMSEQAVFMIEKALSTPTLIEDSQLMGQANAAGINAQADNLSPERQMGAGLIPKPVKGGGKSGSTSMNGMNIPALSFSDLEGNFENTGNAPGRISINDLKGQIVDQGAKQISGDLANASEAKGIREVIRASARTFDTINRQKLNFQSTPEAAGISGYINDNFGGLLQQAADSPLPVINTIAQGVDEQLTKSGIDQEEIQRVRTEAQGAVASLITLMTGDTSGRFTDKEQEITRIATKVQSAKASTGQIMGALTALNTLAQSAFIPEIATYLDSQGTDLNTEQGQLTAIQALKNFGVNDEQAIEMIAQIIEKRQ